MRGCARVFGTIGLVLATAGALTAGSPGGVRGQGVAAAACADPVSARPEWSWLGAIAARPARELTRRSLEGVDAATLGRAMQQLRRAAVQPTVCRDDGVALAALAVALQDRVALREARSALERTVGSLDDPVARLWIARAAAAAGAADAMQLAQAAMVAGADGSGAALAAARAGFALGLDAPAATAYFQGLERAGDGDGLAGYLGDLAPLVRPGESEELADLDASGQAAWIARFWIRRAAESGVTVQERLAEHYRRVRAAYADYCVTCALEPARDPVVPWARVGMGLDQRGLVFLLQGEPDAVVRTDGDALPPNASWAWSDGRDFAVHFALLDPESGWEVLEDPLSLVNPVFDPLSLDTLATPDRAGVRSCVVDGCEGRYVADYYRYLLDRGAIDPRFRTVANQYRSRPTEWGEQASSDFIIGGPLGGQPSFRFAAEEQLAEIRARDRFHPGRAALGEPAFRAVAFRDADGTQPVHLAVTGVLPDTLPRPARVDVALSSDGDDVVAAPAEPGAAWVAPLEGVNDGPWRVAATFREGPDATAAIVASARGEVVVDRPDGAGLALSDPIAWRLDSGADPDSTRAGALRRLVPLPALESGETLALYYEIYGLPQDQLYETRIRIGRVEEGGFFRRLGNLFGGDDPSELSLPGETFGEPPEVRPQAIAISVPELDSGLYRAEVEVRHRLHRVVREVAFQVR